MSHFFEYRRTALEFLYDLRRKILRTMFKLALPFVLAAALAAGCAAPYNRNFPLIEKRMPQARVVELLGAPISAQSGPGESKILFWRLASSPLDTDGSDTREYWVQIVDDQVIGYGERTDQLTMLRQATQFKSAWNAAALTSAASQALIQTMQPALQRPSESLTPPKNTSCTAIGNSVNCRSY